MYRYCLYTPEKEQKLPSNDVKFSTRLHLRVLKYSKFSQRGGGTPPLRPFPQARTTALQLAQRAKLLPTPE